MTESILQEAERIINGPRRDSYLNSPDILDFRKVSVSDFNNVLSGVIGVDVGENLAGICMRLTDSDFPFIRDPVKCAWVAGIVEGEGCFIIHPKSLKKGRHYPTFAIRVNMTDEDVILKLKEFVGVGTVRGPILQKNPKHKPFWAWTVTRRDHVFLICSALEKYMGKRRRDRIKIVTDEIQASGHIRWRHGTRTGYENHKCRCEECTKSNTERHARRRLKLVTQKQDCVQPGLLT